MSSPVMPTEDQQPDVPPEVQARFDTLATEPLQSAGAPQGLLRGTWSSIQAIFGYRELLDLLIRRELKTKYKDSVLGFVWTLIRPLVTLLVYFIVIGQFLGVARGIPDFPIYMFAGLTLWALFLECVAGGTGSVLGNAGLVKKVYLPREVFPLSAVGSAIFNFVIQIGILVVAVLVTGRFPLGERWLYFPLSVAMVLVWGTALGMLLGAINVYLRDIQYLVEVVLTVMFWACPIIYKWEYVAAAAPAWAQSIYLSNPVAVAVMGIQKTFWVAGDGQPVPAHLGTRIFLFTLLGLVLLWLAQRIFARLQSNFAQEL